MVQKVNKYVQYLSIDIITFKMPGWGIAFVLITQTSQNFNLKTDQIISICERTSFKLFQFILFKKIEKKEDFYKNFSSGLITKEIEKNNKKETELYKCKNKILVGYNAYTDESYNENTTNEKPNLFATNSRIETY